MFLAYFIFGIVAGYFSGFLGIGAGCLVLPFFIFSNIPYEVAVEATVMTVFLASVTGSIQHFKSNGFAFEPVLMMGIPGAITATIGNFYLIHIVPAIVLQILYAGLLFLNIDLLRINQNREPSNTILNDVNHWNFLTAYIIVGAWTGLMASLFGMGGGLLIVSLLVNKATLKLKDAIRISTNVMVITTLFSILPEMISNTLPYHLGIPSGAGAVIGGFFGIIALKYIRQKVILKINYIISIGLGSSMLFKILLNTL